jgi:hypothetical protein
VVRLAVVVAAGVVAGAVWWWLAPMARTDLEQGSVYLRGHAELQAAQDCWFAVVLGALGVVTATVHAWWSSGRGTGQDGARRSRGASVGQVRRVVGLTAAMLLAALVAWQTGSLLGPGPLAAQVAAGATHPLTPLQLHSSGALLVGPFLFAFTAFLAAVFGAGPDRSG